MPIHIVLASPLQDSTTGELRPIVRDDAGWLPVDTDKRIQFPCNPSARDTGISHQTQVLAAAIIIHGQHAELA